MNDNYSDLFPLINEVWNFLTPNVPLEALKFQNLDYIFVFGGIGKEIPLHAAFLYREKIANKILVSGKSGAYTKKYFDSNESEVFKKVLINESIPIKDILIEPNATNAGENVKFGMDLINQYSENVNNIVIVCRSFMTLRALATFKKQYPSITCLPSPPELDFGKINLPVLRLGKRIIGELDRLNKFYLEGFIEYVEIPYRIKKASEELGFKINELSNN